MQNHATTLRRYPRPPLTRSRRPDPGDALPPAAETTLPPGVTTAQYLMACAEVHTLDAAIRQLGLVPRPHAETLNAKLAALSAEIGGAR